MEENIQPTQQQLPKHKIAFILDDQIVDILHTDDRLAAIILSEPKIINVSDYVDESGNFILDVGMFYDEVDNSFSHKKIYKRSTSE
ncbi:hypothetical protein EB001_08550 [bacterium]|nr:hypothetical protein [bacterium]